MLIAKSSTAGPGGTISSWRFIEEVEVDGKRFPVGCETVTIDNPRFHQKPERRGLAVIEFEGRLLLVSGIIRKKKCQLTVNEQRCSFIPDDPHYRNGVPFKFCGFRLHDMET